ncbi:MAG: hypothetical protein ACTSUE_22720 [Promethearchaeota archaeon]
MTLQDKETPISPIVALMGKEINDDLTRRFHNVVPSDDTDLTYHAFVADENPMVFQLSFFDQKAGPLPLLILGNKEGVDAIPRELIQKTTRHIEMLEPGNVTEVREDDMKRLITRFDIPKTNMRGGVGMFLLNAYYHESLNVGSPPIAMMENLGKFFYSEKFSGLVDLACQRAAGNRVDLQPWIDNISEIRTGIYKLVVHAQSSSVSKEIIPEVKHVIGKLKNRALGPFQVPDAPTREKETNEGDEILTRILSGVRDKEHQVATIKEGGKIDPDASIKELIKEAQEARKPAGDWFVPSKKKKKKKNAWGRIPKDRIMRRKNQVKTSTPSQAAPVVQTMPVIPAKLSQSNELPIIKQPGFPINVILPTKNTIKDIPIENGAIPVQQVHHSKQVPGTYPKYLGKTSFISGVQAAFRRRGYKVETHDKTRKTTAIKFIDVNPKKKGLICLAFTIDDAIINKPDLEIKNRDLHTGQVNLSLNPSRIKPNTISNAYIPRMEEHSIKRGGKNLILGRIHDGEPVKFISNPVVITTETIKMNKAIRPFFWVKPRKVKGEKFIRPGYFVVQQDSIEEFDAFLLRVFSGLGEELITRDAVHLSIARKKAEATGRITRVASIALLATSVFGLLASAKIFGPTGNIAIMQLFYVPIMIQVAIMAILFKVRANYSENVQELFETRRNDVNPENPLHVEPDKERLMIALSTLREVEIVPFIETFVDDLDKDAFYKAASAINEQKDKNGLDNLIKKTTSTQENQLNNITRINSPTCGRNDYTDAQGTDDYTDESVASFSPTAVFKD